MTTRDFDELWHDICKINREIGVIDYGIQQFPNSSAAWRALNEEKLEFTNKLPAIYKKLHTALDFSKNQ